MMITFAQTLSDIANNNGVNSQANRETIRRYRVRQSFLEVSISEREVVRQRYYVDIEVADVIAAGRRIHQG